MALVSLLRIAILALALTACATPLKPTPGMTDPYRGLRGKYPELYNLVGVGEAKLTGNAQRDRQGAEILAKAKIAEQIRVRVKAQILDIVRQEIGKDIKETGEFTQITESHTNEMLEGVKVVENGEDPGRGVVYAVAILPREEAIAPLTTRAELAYKQATILIGRADGAKRAGDAAGAQRFLTEARQTVLNGMALEGERGVIAGGLKDLPGTIPAITGRPDLDAIEAALPPIPSTPMAPSTAPTQPPLRGVGPRAPDSPGEKEGVRAGPPAEAVEVTAESDEPLRGITEDEARNKALENARRNALEQTGVSVRSSSTVYNSALVDDLARIAAQGMIEEQTILEDEIRSVKQPGAARPINLYHIKIKAKIRRGRECEQRGDYELKASLNRNEFNDGDEAKITVNINQKSFLYIFNVDKDGAVLLLLPNSLMRDEQDQTVEAETEFVFPAEASRGRGIKLRVSAEPGVKRTVETIKVIASKKKLPSLVKFQEAVSLFSGFKAKDTALMVDLLKALNSLGCSDWAEATLPFTVVRK